MIVAGKFPDYQDQALLAAALEGLVGPGERVLEPLIGFEHPHTEGVGFFFFFWLHALLENRVTQADC